MIGEAAAELARKKHSLKHPRGKPLTNHSLLSELNGRVKTWSVPYCLEVKGGGGIIF